MTIEARLISNEGVIVAIWEITTLQHVLLLPKPLRYRLDSAPTDFPTAVRYDLDVAFRAEFGDDIIAIYREAPV